MRVYYFLDAYFNAQTDTFGCKIQVFILNSVTLL